MSEIRTIRNVSALKIRGVRGRGHCREVTAFNHSRRDETKTKIFGNEQINLQSAHHPKRQPSVEK